ncbi:sigma factor [Halomonas alimentaria]
MGLAGEAALRPRLLSFARMHLRDNALAEDAVQEALMAAIEKEASFAGRSGYETWVLGIVNTPTHHATH